MLLTIFLAIEISSDTPKLLNKKILVTWVEAEKAVPSTLGTCSLFNKQAINLFIREGTEQGTGRIYIYISLVVVAQVSTKQRNKEIRLLFSPHTFNKNLDSPLDFKSPVSTPSEVIYT